MPSGGTTRTGAVLEAMVLPALRLGGYRYETQVRVGERLGGGRHFVDVVASKDGEREILVSVKWQQVSGTAEQKVPFEVMCLQEAMERSGGTYSCAYLVLGGPGWKLRDFYTAGGLNRFIAVPDAVRIVTLEAFVARANAGGL